MNGLSYLVGLLAMWVFSDAVYSYCLYKGSTSYRGEPQDWLHDHWVRAVRALIALFIMVVVAPIW